MTDLTITDIYFADQIIMDVAEKGKHAIPIEIMDMDNKSAILARVRHQLLELRAEHTSPKYDHVRAQIDQVLSIYMMQPGFYD